MGEMLSYPFIFNDDFVDEAGLLMKVYPCQKMLWTLRSLCVRN